MRLDEEVTLAVCAKANMIGQVGMQHNLLQPMGVSTEQQVYTPAVHTPYVSHLSCCEFGRALHCKEKEMMKKKEDFAACTC